MDVNKHLDVTEHDRKSILNSKWKQDVMVQCYYCCSSPFWL